MARGGVRPGSGRPKGAATKRTREIADKAAAEGITPLEYLLNLMRDASADPDARFRAALGAAPYVHPKLAQIQHQGDEEKPLIPTRVEHVIIDPQA
jgi:hypothetical protein